MSQNNKESCCPRSSHPPLRRQPCFSFHSLLLVVLTLLCVHCNPTVAFLHHHGQQLYNHHHHTTSGKQLLLYHPVPLKTVPWWRLSSPAAVGKDDPISYLNHPTKLRQQHTTQITAMRSHYYRYDDDDSNNSNIHTTNNSNKDLVNIPRNNNKHGIMTPRRKNLWKRIRNQLWLFWMTTRKSTKKLLLSAMVVFAALFLPSAAEAAVSGGRMGGSFKSSSPSRTPSRSYSPSRNYNSYSRPPSPRPIRPRVTVAPYAPRVHQNPQIKIYQQQHHARSSQRQQFVSNRGKLILTGTGVALAAGLQRSRSPSPFASPNLRYYAPTDNHDGSSPLGPGITVTSMTVELDVRNRDDPNSILSKLQQIYQTVQTDSRRGIQDMVENVALEILRKADDIRSAEWKYSHFNQEAEAQSEFYRQSFQFRKKFDQETASKFGEKSTASSSSSSSSTSSMTTTTQAIITILLSIQGTSILPKKRDSGVKSLEDVEKVMTQFSVDSQVEECLCAAEVAWAPELRSESLSREEVIVLYPTLYPIN